jgi:hypothetical protein
MDTTAAIPTGWTIKNNIFDNINGTGGKLPMKIEAGISFTANNNLFYSPVEGSNLVSNNSFETFTGTPDNGVTDDFDDITENAANGYIEAATTTDAALSSIPDGIYCMKLDKTPVGGAQNMQLSFTLEAYAPYEISLYAISDGSGTGRMAIFHGGTYLQDDSTWVVSANWDIASLGVGTGDNTWTQKTHTFISNAAATYTIRYENQTGNASTFLDNIIIKRLGSIVANYYRAPMTLAQYQSESSQDANGVYDSPLFTDAANDDFTLRPLSPCIDNGIDVGLVRDFNNDILYGIPDIGAFEYIPPEKGFETFLRFDVFLK